MECTMQQLEERPVRWYWRDLQIDLTVEFPTEEPAEPEIGAGWYNQQSYCLCIWDGHDWVCVPLD
jgi:hypothetical protein